MGCTDLNNDNATKKEVEEIFQETRHSLGAPQKS